MNEILKQRLVGALILVALAVVFWPIVFVEPEEQRNAHPQSIPEPPAVSTSAIEAPDEAGLRGSGELAEYDEAQGTTDPTTDTPADVNAGTDSTTDPEMDAVSVPGGGEPSPNPQVASATPAQPATKPSATTPNATAPTPVVRSEAPRPLAMDAAGVPVAWTLQVATVSSAEKAEALRRRLLDKHEKAYVTTISSSGKQLYRVSVGPKFERQELERIQASINAEFGVNSMVVRYLP